MANNLINTKQLIDDLNNAWAKHTQYLDTASSAYLKLVNSAKLPSSYVEAVKTQAENNKKLEKSVKDLERAELKAQRARVAELKLQAKREKAFDNYEKQLVREQRLLDKTQGLYNRVQRGINQVTKQYQDLAIRKELNGKLSAEEEITLGKLEAKLNKYQSALKKVDANIGKHQRNVGNYKSTFDGLGFSVAQLSRELPAFANSVQTGFMAISNNIPMLVDEITRLKKANIELAAAGKPTTSVMRSIGKAIFSLNGMLGIAITALTVFAPKLFEWAFGMTEAEKATQKANEELEEQNKKLRENIDLRNRQIKGIREFLDDPTLNQAFRAALADEDTERANLALIELSDRLQKIGAKNADVLKDQTLSTRDRLNVAGNLLEIEQLQGKLQTERMRIQKIQTRRSELDELVETGKMTVQQRAVELRKLGNTSLEETLALQQRILQLEKANEMFANRRVEIEEKETKKIKKRKKDLDWLTNVSKGYTEEWRKMFEIDFDKFNEDLNEQVKATERWEAVMRKLRKETETFLSGFTDDFVKNSPLSGLMVFADGTFETLMKGADTSSERFALAFNTIAESAQQAFSFIDSLSQANFEAQYSRLEQQKNWAIQFAGDSTTAQAEIERQYEERRKQIQIKQAKAQKDQAIFNIGVDTAQAIMATASQLGFPAAIPMISLISALGLAQLVAVQSQQIPQFWQGGEVGGMQDIIVNDDPFGLKGSNYKEVIEKPNGQILTPQGKNVKMRVPKGSYVHPTYDAFINSLDNELINNNIMPIGQSNIMPMIVNDGLTKADVMEVMSAHGKGVVRAINNKESFKFNIDERGINKYVVKNGQTRKIMNSRYSGKGIGV